MDHLSHPTNAHVVVALVVSVSGRQLLDFQGVRDGNLFHRAEYSWLSADFQPGNLEQAVREVTAHEGALWR